MLFCSEAVSSRCVGRCSKLPMFAFCISARKAFASRKFGQPFPTVNLFNHSQLWTCLLWAYQEEWQRDCSSSLTCVKAMRFCRWSCCDWLFLCLLSHAWPRASGSSFHTRTQFLLAVSVVFVPAEKFERRLTKAHASVALIDLPFWHGEQQSQPHFWCWTR